MKRKRGGKVGGKRGGKLGGSSIKEDEISKCEGSSIKEEVISMCEESSIKEDEISKCEGSSIKEEEISMCEESSIKEDETGKCEGSSIEEDEISKCGESSIKEDENGKWGEPSIDENDRISKFADEIIHHILSCMDMKFAVETFVLLSKRWNYMVTSLPTIKLDYSLQAYGGESDEFNTELITKALESRKYIQRLHVNLPYEYVRPVYRWIQAALGANVEDICISHTGDNIQIPDGTFSSESLKKLTLVVPRVPIDLSKSVDLPSLVYLKLDYIPSANGEEINKLVASCPVIEYLDLMLRDRNTYHGGIKIRSPVLKHLQIRKPHGRISLSLYAPNLVSLIFESAANNVYLEDVSSIVNATIDTKGASSLSNATMVAEDEGDDISASLVAQKTSLEVLRNVQCLTIPVPTLQDILGLPEFLEKQVDDQFGNLQKLKLLQVDFTWSTSVFNVASFLSMSPNIESLTLEVIRDRDWESAPSQNELKMELETMSPMFTLNKLKTVMVSNFQGSPIELKLLEILLSKASVLEVLDIFIRPIDRLAVPSVRAKIRQDLQVWRKNSGFPAISTNFDVIDSYSENAI